MAKSNPPIPPSAKPAGTPAVPPPPRMLSPKDLLADHAIAPEGLGTNEGPAKHARPTFTYMRPPGFGPMMTPETMTTAPPTAVDLTEDNTPSPITPPTIPQDKPDEPMQDYDPRENLLSSEHILECCECAQYLGVAFKAIADPGDRPGQTECSKFWTQYWSECAFQKCIKAVIDKGTQRPAYDTPNESAIQIVHTIHVAATCEAQQSMANMIMEAYRQTDFSLLALLTVLATDVQATIINKSITMRQKMLLARPQQKPNLNEIDIEIMKDDKAQYQRFAALPHYYYFPMNPKKTKDALCTLTLALGPAALYTLQTPTIADCEDKSLFETKYPTPLKLTTNTVKEGAFCHPSALAMRIIH